MISSRHSTIKTSYRPPSPPYRSRFDIVLPRGRRLRVLIYARYSTEEQDPRSIEDQASYCRRFLGTFEFTDADLDITLLFDRETSGELIFRPGINQVREGIHGRQWDLIVAEDASRLFRDVAACLELVRMAFDEKIRVIAINDEVDTADEENWEDRLYEAGRHHARTNRYTSKRIKRTHEALWEMGAAIGKLKPGYRRFPFHGGAGSDAARGPFRDELDAQWQAIMQEAYERIASGEPSWSVGRFLTEKKFPKASGSRTPEYGGKDTIAFIRREDHRGLQTFRKTVSKKVLSQGKRKSERNDPTKILVRQMPHLRVVSDALWLRANDAITNACKNRKAAPTGRDHPLAGISRDSRGPLSGVFLCGCCSQKMYVDGRREGGYRCRNVRKGTCWNKASGLRTVTHRQIGESIIAELGSLDPELDRLIERVRTVLDDQGSRCHQRERLQGTEREALEALDNLNKVAEKAMEVPETILERIGYWQDILDRSRADQESLDCQDQLRKVPTREELDQSVARLIAQFQEMKRTIQADLKVLVGRIEAVPYQQFGTDKIVLRARFELDLVGLLSAPVRAVLAAISRGPIAKCFGTIPMLVDLFERSTGPMYGLAARKLSEEGLGLTAIGRALGITKRKANIAVQYGKALREAGLADPYVECTEPPRAASRWRLHPSHKPRQDDDRQGA